MPVKLFLCNTPLQLLIASRIIATESIQLHDCAVLYVCDRFNAKANSALVKVSSLVKYATLIEKARSISGVRDMRKFISMIGPVDEIFVACIDDSLAHYAISFTNGATLKTFDDGTANILPGSSYFNDKKKGSVRALALSMFHRLNGNRYDMQKVKNESQVHYSIYTKYENAMSNVAHIEIFNEEQKKKDECHLFNGVNYVDYCKNKNDANSLKMRVLNFLKSTSGDTIYISPGDKDNRLFNEFIVKNDLIDIEYLESLRGRYSVVNIYGFADYLQNISIDIEGVVVRPIISSLLLDEVNTCSDVLSSRCGVSAISL